MSDPRFPCPCGLVHHRPSALDAQATDRCELLPAHAFWTKSCDACGRPRTFGSTAARYRATDDRELCGDCAFELNERSGRPRIGAAFRPGEGSILDSTCDVLVSPVNLVGASGAGLALAFKRAYPEQESRFVRWTRGDFPAQAIMVAGAQRRDGSPVSIAYLPTKRHWREDSSLALIDEYLGHLARTLAPTPLRSVAVPALGCGLGKLDWSEVRPHVVGALGGVEGLKVELYEPRPTAVAVRQRS